MSKERLCDGTPSITPGTYKIPYGCEALIKDGKVQVRFVCPELTEFERKLAEILDHAMRHPTCSRERIENMSISFAPELSSVLFKEQMKMADRVASTLAGAEIKYNGLDISINRNKVLAKILTWEDVKSIMDIIYDLSPMVPTQDWEIYAEFHNMEGFCREVLKRLGEDK